MKRKEAWLNLVYLYLLFPVTILVFVASATFLLTSAILRLDPITQLLFNRDVNNDFTLQNLGLPQVIENNEIIFLSFIGYLVMTFQLHIVNWFVTKHHYIVTTLIRDMSGNGSNG